jgi:hypothetical protein
MVEARILGGRTAARAAAFARTHWFVLAILALAAAIRVLVAVAYRPALFFSDSWAYVRMAFGASHFAPDRPSGYPGLLWAIDAPRRSLVAVTTVQHIAGLVTAALSYALLRRLGVSRWPAAGATGLIALDAYAIALEQTILAEAFFTVTLVLGAFLVAGKERGDMAVAASGAALALAATMRPVALFAVPAWFVYLLLRHRRLRVLALSLSALLVPLLVYAAVYDANQGRFGLTKADGWFLYGRVGEIADCSKFDPPQEIADLCQPLARSNGEGPLYYLWSGRSPANRKYGLPSGSDGSRPLQRFAFAVIRGRPAAYAELVGRDFLRYFQPGIASRGESDTAIELQARPRTGPPWMNESIRASYLPTYRPSVRAPAGVARAYSGVVHPPRPLLALLVLATIATVALALMGRGRWAPQRWPESLLLTGMGVSMLFGTALTSSFVIRYLVPTVPLLICGGTIALADLAGLRRGR